MEASARAGSPRRGGLAAVGRVVLYVVLAVVCMVLVATLAGLAAQRLGWGAGGPALEAWLQLAAVLASTWIVLRWVERRPWGDIGLGRAQAGALPLVEGWILGALAIGVPAIALAAIGWLRFAPAPDGSWWSAALHASVLLMPAALMEEVFVRGYPFAVLRRQWGGGVAVAVTSLVFGVLHIWNDHASPLSIGLVTLAGFFLGGVVLVTGSVWAAWTAHLAWNWTMAVLLHTPVSGIPLAAPDYRLLDAGPDWATGGVWGPEGGAAAGVGMLGGIGYLIARRRRRGELWNT